MGRVHLERALSKLGVMSRAQTKRCIEEGRIAVDGRVIKEPSFLLVPEKARITVDGRPVRQAVATTILFHKPKGVVTTRSDEKGRRTIYDLLPPDLRHLHPVGRLDMATTGLLIMTTDTQLSNFLTDPKNKIPRTYVVTVKGKMTDNETKRMLEGIEDKGELLKAATVRLRKTSNKESHLIIELTEGKNREVRRLFESLGSEVIALKRIAFGNFKLGELQAGQYQRVARIGVHERTTTVQVIR